MRKVEIILEKSWDKLLANILFCHFDASGLVKIKHLKLNGFPSEVTMKYVERLVIHEVFQSIWIMSRSHISTAPQTEFHIHFTNTRLPMDSCKTGYHLSLMSDPIRSKLLHCIKSSTCSIRFLKPC
jgi:hypothetical protein